MRLWQQVAMVIAAVSVVTLVISGSAAIWIAGTSATNTADLAQERDVVALADTVERWLGEQSAFLTGWALAFELPQLDEARQQGLLRAILSAMPSTRQVCLIDTNGQLVGQAVALEDATPIQALVDAFPVTSALGSPEGIAFGTPTSRGTLPLAVVASRDPVLLVGAELDIEVARDLEARSTRQHAVVLVDAQGVPIVGGDAPLLDLELLQPVLGNVAHGLSYQNGDTRVRGAVAPVRRTGWSVIMLQSEAIALEGATYIRRLLPVVVFVSIVFALVMGMVLAQSVTRPIATLRDSALQLAEGRFGATTQIDRQDEVGELARAFDHLSRNLAENQAEILRQREEIEAFNRELQQRVDAATAELREAQEQLVRAGQLAAVAQMGAGLAHELNNPLTAVLGMAQLVRARAPDAVAEDLELLEREALRCRAVVDAMVRMADSSDRGPTELAEVLEDVRDAAGAALRQRGVALIWSDLGEASVEAGPGDVRRALNQLISALAAGLPAGGRLRTEVDVAGGVPVIRFFPSHPIGSDQDDWMASGLDLWLARQTLDQLGAALVEPLEHDGPWQVRWGSPA